MKPKSRPEPAVVDAHLMEAAKQFVFDPKPRPTFQCLVCSGPGATDDSEGLCWVCRRLKISAWREIEVQMPMNE